MSAPEEVIRIDDPDTGLRAVIVIDSTALGPAAGGVRTMPYDSWDAAEVDARRLARAMTLKCAIGGLAAGGSKCAVIEHAGMDRARAFARLGREVEAMGGRFRTGGDLGTHKPDIAAMSSETEYVHCEHGSVTDAVGEGVVRCAQAAMEFLGHDLEGAEVLVQGLGAVGEPVARGFRTKGAKLWLADLDREREETLVDALGAERFTADPASASVDVFAPSAVGSVLSKNALSRGAARVVCGAANNIFADDEAMRAYHAAGVLVVPDFLASAGGVIDGIARSVMGMADPGPLVRALAQTTTDVLERSKKQSAPTTEVAEELARDRVSRRGK